MKAIILAAGEGKRLRPLTEKLPKSMIKIFGKILLQIQIETMKRCGINEIIVVTGYKSDLINIPNLTYENNPDFKNTNMVETLFCAKDHLDGEIIVSYADIIYERNILKKLIDTENDFSIIIDKNWKSFWEKRFDEPLNDAETLKINSDGNISEIGQKTKNISEIEGQYIGLMKFSSNGTKILREFYDKCKNNSENEKNPLNQKIPFKKSYMTDLLQGLINESFQLKPVFIEGGWIELDSIDDFKLYNKLFDEDNLKQLIDLDE